MVTGAPLAEEGTFESTGLPELFVRIWRWSFTGTLRIDYRKLLRIITFKEGNLLGITTDHVEDSVEEFIRRSGKLSPDQVGAVLERKAMDEETTTAFVRSGLLTAREAEEILRTQIVTVLSSLLSVGVDGHYVIQSSKIEWEGPVFPAASILLDAVIQCPDRHWIADRLSMETVLELAAESGAATSVAREEDAPLLRLADGSRTVEEICRSSSRDNFFVCKFLYGMELLGALQRKLPASERKKGRRLLIRKEEGAASVSDSPTSVLDALAARRPTPRPRVRPLLLWALFAVLLVGIGVVTGTRWRTPSQPPQPKQPTFFDQGAGKKPPAKSSPQTQEAVPQVQLDPTYAAVQAGEIDTAVALSRERLLKAGLNLYSIVLEIDCQTGSVQEAYRAASGSSSLFILSTIHRGSKCYSVCWGLYRTWIEAQQDTQRLPPYFRSQGGHKIVLLADLLVSD